MANPSQEQDAGGTSIDDEHSVLDVVARRVAARQRQVDIGKARTEYVRYQAAVPKDQRTPSRPQTPDPAAPVSKRQFDRLLSEWRRLLHEYDDPDAPEHPDEIDETVFCPSTSSGSAKTPTRCAASNPAKEIPAWPLSALAFRTPEGNFLEHPALSSTGPDFSSSCATTGGREPLHSRSSANPALINTTSASLRGSHSTSATGTESRLGGEKRYASSFGTDVVGRESHSGTQERVEYAISRCGEVLLMNPTAVEDQNIMHKVVGYTESRAGSASSSSASSCETFSQGRCWPPSILEVPTEGSSHDVSKVSLAGDPWKVVTSAAGAPCYITLAGCECARDVRNEVKSDATPAADEFNSQSEGCPVT
jgi:hypothetical protein